MLTLLSRRSYSTVAVVNQATGKVLATTYFPNEVRTFQFRCGRCLAVAAYSSMWHL